MSVLISILSNPIRYQLALCERPGEVGKSLRFFVPSFHQRLAFDDFCWFCSLHHHVRHWEVSNYSDITYILVSHIIMSINLLYSNQDT